MILRVNDSYIEIDIEIERSLKLFDDNISGINGDYSYSVTIANTSHNRTALNITTVDDGYKVLYRKQDATIESGGVQIYSGYVRIDKVNDKQIDFSFFSGNSVWFSDLDFNIRDLDMSKYDMTFNVGNILASMLETTGVVFPVVDKGCLETRKSIYLDKFDFHPFIHVKNIFESITTFTGIKFTGDLFTDGNFQRLITSNNSRQGLQKEIDDRSIHAYAQVDQTLTHSTWNTAYFPGTTNPFYNSPNNNWNIVTGVYTVDTGIAVLKISIKLELTCFYSFRFLVNGTDVYFTTGIVTSFTYSNEFYLKNLDAGDTIILQIYPINTSVFTFPFILKNDSTIKFDVIKFNTAVYGNSLLPNRSCVDFVSDIFKLFNAFINYDPNSRTLTASLLKNIKSRHEFDISPYVSSIEYSDYSEFISNYARNNYLLYSDQSNDNVSDYNDEHAIPYGGGVITVDNDFIENEINLIELDFVAAFQKNVPILGTKLPFLDYAEVTEVDGETTRSITSVADYGDGTAQINHGGSAISVGILVRITDSSFYNGDYFVFTSGSGNITLYDCYYVGTDTGTITLIEISDKDNDEQTLLLYQKTTLFTTWSGATQCIISTSGSKLTSSFAYFYLTKFQYPIDYGSLKQALFFNEVDDATVQIDLSGYHSITEEILNDPVLVSCIAYIPEKVYINIDLLNPTRLKVDKFDSQFIINRITGYKNSYTPCTVELIKLP